MSGSAAADALTRRAARVTVRPTGSATIRPGRNPLTGPAASRAAQPGDRRCCTEARNRIRPTLEALQVLGVLRRRGPRSAIPGRGPTASFAPVTAVVQVGEELAGVGEGPGRPSPGGQAGTGPESGRLGPITLRNDTATTIRLSVRWAGSTQGYPGTLAPNQVERVTFRQVERVGPGLTAIIQVRPGGGRDRPEGAGGVRGGGPGRVGRNLVGRRPGIFIPADGGRRRSDLGLAAPGWPRRTSPRSRASTPPGDPVRRPTPR